MPSGTELDIDHEVLINEINQVYDRVFSNEDEFRKYFFATPDLTKRDAQIRVGVFLRRLMEDPSERFWFARKKGRNSNFPQTSIHHLGPERGNGHFTLNGHMECQLETWRDQQPTDRQIFFQLIRHLLLEQLQLPAPEDDVPQIIDQNAPPVIRLIQEDIVKVATAILGKKAVIDGKDFPSGGARVKIETDQFSCEINLSDHDELGTAIRVNFSDDSMKLDPDFMQEFNRYYERVVTPRLLENMIGSLNPRYIKTRITKGIEEDGIFEGMILTPGKISPRYREHIKSDQYFATGRGVDLKSEYAYKLGMVTEDRQYHDRVDVDGWFMNEEQLWHALFATEYPGSFDCDNEQADGMALVIREVGNTTTHQTVIDSLADDGHGLEEFLKEASQVIGSYRAFTPNDSNIFSFPDGYCPVAVSIGGDFAIGYKRMDEGLALCFQLPNEMIIEQIEDEMASNLRWIEELKKRNLELENLKSAYSSL